MSKVRRATHAGSWYTGRGKIFMLKYVGKVQMQSKGIEWKTKEKKIIDVSHHVPKAYTNT